MGISEKFEDVGYFIATFMLFLVFFAVIIDHLLIRPNQLQKDTFFFILSLIGFLFSIYFCILTWPWKSINLCITAETIQFTNSDSINPFKNEIIFSFSKKFIVKLNNNQDTMYFYYQQERKAKLNLVGLTEHDIINIIEIFKSKENIEYKEDPLIPGLRPFPVDSIKT